MFRLSSLTGTSPIAGSFFDTLPHANEEGDETFDVVLSSPSGSQLGQPFEARVTILDDDTIQSGGPCVSGPKTLCLNKDRFKVTARWQTKDALGTGDAKELNRDSGFFTFFNPDNAEVLVKVLNACGLTNTYWTFISGLTNVFVEITVEDVVTGERHSWTNPQGRDFVLIKNLEFFGNSCK